MDDIFGSDSTTTTNSSSNSSGSSSTNNYGSSESQAMLQDLYSRLQSALGTTNQYEKSAADNLSSLAGNSTLQGYANGNNLDVTNNPIYTKASDAITNNAMDAWENAAGQINDTFANSSFWSGSPHENALISGAEKVSSDLADSQANYWKGVLQNEEGNTLSAYNSLTNANNSLASTGNTMNDDQTALLQMLSSLVQSNNDTTTNYNSSTNGNSTSDTQKSGMGDFLGTALGIYAKTMTGGTGAGKTSDKRIKSNIVTIDDALNIVKKLNPVTFFKHDFVVDPVERKIILDDSGKETSGFIAQEVEKVIPSAVSVPKEEWQVYRIYENELIPYLCGAIQELARRVEQLERRE